MVRPIEMTDSFSKLQEAGRMQQAAQLRPEIANELQKTAQDRQHTQSLQSPPPVKESDQVVLHVDDEEGGAREHQGGKHRKASSGKASQDASTDTTGQEDDTPPTVSGGHIDIRI